MLVMIKTILYEGTVTSMNFSKGLGPARSKPWKPTVYIGEGEDSEDRRQDPLGLHHWITRPQQLLRWATVCHNRHGPKSGGDCCCCTPFGGAGPPSNTQSQCRLGRRLPLYQVAWIHPAVSPQQTWAKIGGGCAPTPFSGGGSLMPCTCIQ